MKSCPNCRRVYSEEAGFCPADGSALLALTEVPVELEKDARLGTRLGKRYELRRIVADGAMGRVYEGVDIEAQRRVAVKVLHPQVARDAVSLERFKREYEVSAQLPHTQIIEMLDFQRDVEADCQFLVMEFLDGEELSVVLKRDNLLGPGRLVRMLSQIAIGLDEAHKRQFIHRDLKPDNLFLCGTREGDNVKILDFGSVKDKNVQSKKLTVMGTTIGTPYYMAPEQAQGLDSLDGRADVFALGAIAYECLTGKIAFNGRSGPEILMAIMTKEPVPLSELAPDLPAKLEIAVEAALAKNPAIRTKTCGEFAEAVGHAVGLHGAHTDWARIPEEDLEAKIATERQRRASLAPPVREAVVVKDPFASGASAPPARGNAAAMDAAFSAAREADYEGAIAGMPKESPKWVIPAVVVAVLAVIGIVVKFVL